MRMRTAVTVAVAYSLGYVAGAKAGRPAYERLVDGVGRLKSDLGFSGRAEQMGATLKENAARVAESATSTVEGLVDTAGDIADERLSRLNTKAQEAAAG